MYFFQSEIAQMWLKQWIKFTLSSDRIINQCDAKMQTQIQQAFHRTVLVKFNINNSLIKL